MLETPVEMVTPIKWGRSLV